MKRGIRDYEFLKVDVSDDGVMATRMDSPESRNAVGAIEWTELSRIWRDVATDGDVKVIILTGNRRCLGREPQEIRR